MSVAQATEAWLRDGQITSLPANESEMRESLIRILCAYLGLPVSGPLGWVLRGALSLPAGRFTKLSIEFDEIVAREGYRSASAWMVSRFMPSLQVRGHELIARSGPVLIVANHPGTFDSFAVAASLPRDDFKVITRGYPFLRALPSTSPHLVFSELELYARMAAARGAIRHLREGGALLVFPSGGMEPDPACLPGADAALDTWYSGMEILLRSVPGAQVHVCALSGFLERRYADHLLARLPKGSYERQIVAEALQFSGHLLLNRKVSRGPWALFSPAFEASALADGSGRVLPRIVQIARETLAQVSPPSGGTV